MTEFQKKSFSVSMSPRPEYGACPKCGGMNRMEIKNVGMTDQVYCPECRIISRRKNDQR